MAVLPRHAPVAPVTPDAPSTPRAEQRASRSFFPEIQVLRAVAVMLVVLYHYWPDTLTGGYVGVDAFRRRSSSYCSPRWGRSCCFRPTCGLRQPMS